MAQKNLFARQHLDLAMVSSRGQDSPLHEPAGITSVEGFVVRRIEIAGGEAQGWEYEGALLGVHQAT